MLSSTNLRCWQSAVLGAEIKMKDSVLSSSKPPTISNAGYSPHASVSGVLCYALTQTHQLMRWIRRLEYKSLFIAGIWLPHRIDLVFDGWLAGTYWLTIWLADWLSGWLTDRWLKTDRRLTDWLTHRHPDHPLTHLLTHERTYYIRTYQCFQYLVCSLRDNHSCSDGHIYWHSYRNKHSCIDDNTVIVVSVTVFVPIRKDACLSFVSCYILRCSFVLLR